MDSQAVKTTEAGGIKGYGKEKATKGRKRFVFVDILGLLLCALILPAHIQDRDGGAALLRLVHAQYPSIQKAFVDSAFNSTPIEQASKDTGIEVERKAKPEGQPGFVPIPKRWVVERTNAWVGRYRRNSKDYERRTDSSESMIRISSINLMLRRLAPNAKVQTFNYRPAA